MSPSDEPQPCETDVDPGLATDPWPSLTELARAATGMAVAAVCLRGDGEAWQRIVASGDRAAAERLAALPDMGAAAHANAAPTEVRGAPETVLAWPLQAGHLQSGAALPAGVVFVADRAGACAPQQLQAARDRVAILIARFDEQARLERRLAADARQFREVVAHAPTGMLVIDAEGRIRYVNTAAEQLLGRAQGDLLDTELGVPGSVSGPTADGLELDILRPDGDAGVAQLSATTVTWEGRNAWLVMLDDITARRRAEAQVERMAYQDGLTGVANRVRLRERLETAVNGARRRSDQCIGLVMLDVDRFTEINESLGRAAGDEFLIGVAHRLEEIVREHDLVARLGGDEFAILFEGLPCARGAVAVAKKILQALDRPLTAGERELRTSASLGISLFPADAGEPSTLLQHADTALSASKAAGGAGFRLFDEQLGVRAAQRLDIDQRLRQAIDANEFEAYYQAQVALHPGARMLSGFEALARWHHPERGLVRPGEFIEALEDMNLIGALGDRMLTQAIARLAEWGEALSPGTAVAVNVSAHQLYPDQSFVERVLELLAHYRVAPEHLMIELTESAIASQMGSSVDALRALDRAGVRIALDDFGTGYSALSYLRILPVSLVKIDRSFITDLPDDRSSAALVRAIVEMAHGVDREVLAEGVETEAQAVFLREVGCDYAQGFRYARAETAADVRRRWLASPG